MRTRLSICAKKRRYASYAEVLRVIERAGTGFRSYKCDRCGRYHLTSRTKGKRISRSVAQAHAGSSSGASCRG